ncbi:MAG: zinc ribbon domain-containing protein [Planctomycetota bacterium]|nr:zinc ribbon domain-containing protein [Planctomycetota bacterium]
MSRFFSTKALKYRRLEAAGEIEDDRPCPHCGYNLRGLPEGRVCPECGGDPSPGASDAASSPVGETARRPLVDVFMTGPEEERRRWQIGFTIAAWCVAAATAGRVLFFLVSIPGDSAPVERTYLGFALLAFLVWIGVSWCLLPARLGMVWPWTASWRWFVLTTQWLWVIAYGAAMLDELGAVAAGQARLVLTGEVIAFLVAGVGALVLVYLMRHVAEEAEIEPAAGRLNLALWLMPIVAPLAVMTALAFPTSMGNPSRSPWGLVSLILVLPPIATLAAWAWLMILLALAFWQMQRHTYWVKRLVLEAQGRDERIAAKRRRLEREAGGQIRALPEGKEDEGDVAPEEAKS